MKWLKHAFAVDATGPVEPTESQRAIVDKVCCEVVRRHLTTPALLALEMSRPLNYVASQVLHFFGLFVSAITDAEGHKHFAMFLEQRGSIDYLCRRIEDLEAEATNHTKTPPSEPTEKSADGLSMPH